VCFSPKDDHNPSGSDHKQNTRKCVGSNGEINFNMKSDMNGGRLEVKLTRLKAGELQMKMFEVRQKIRMENWWLDC
jgi:hypothetical protein